MLFAGKIIANSIRCYSESWLCLYCPGYLAPRTQTHAMETREISDPMSSESWGVNTAGANQGRGQANKFGSCVVM